MNRQPDGKPQRTEPVAFTKFAADRIARVVRLVEAGGREQQPLKFTRVGATPASLKVGTFTGSWDAGTFKTVTLSGSTNTASVYNWSTPVVTPTTNTSCERFVVFGPAAGKLSALEVQLQVTCQTCLLSFGNVDLTDIENHSPNKIQLLGKGENGCIRWFDISTCATATAAP